MNAVETLRRLPGTPLWFKPTPARPALEGNAQADVAIVGAGYTGLWAAYYLLKEQPSLRVVIIEREHVGFGASGRNGGWASAIFPISLKQVSKFSSHADALHLQAAMNDTVDEIGRVLAAEGIEADYAREGFVSLARTPAQMARASAPASGARLISVCPISGARWTRPRLGTWSGRKGSWAPCSPAIAR